MILNKPLGIKSYGTIPHLIGSRITPSDKHCHEGQARIATLKVRDRHDVIIVTEKLDGSNMGICKVEGKIIAISRAGYLATTSPYEQHWHFASWVARNQDRFDKLLTEGERVCGEWLMQAHGTRYTPSHEPLVIFDIMRGHQRVNYSELIRRCSEVKLTTPYLLHHGCPIGIEQALALLGVHGFHGAVDEAEGIVWRIEKKGRFDFMVKYVRPEKKDGIYLPKISNQGPIWNYSLGAENQSWGK